MIIQIISSIFFYPNFTQLLHGKRYKNKVSCDDARLLLLLCGRLLGLHVEVIQLLQDLIIDVCGIVLVFNGHVNGIPRNIICNGVIKSMCWILVGFLELKIDLVCQK
jgi:hypothetical protein